jgi:hypothetical protein
LRSPSHELRSSQTHPFAASFEPRQESGSSIEHLFGPMATQHRPQTFDLAAVKGAITDLPRADRARLQSWILARFDVRGYPAPGAASLDETEARSKPGT